VQVRKVLGESQFKFPVGFCVATFEAERHSMPMDCAAQNRICGDVERGAKRPMLYETSTFCGDRAGIA
jgi:hypothetical protein